MLQTVYFTVFQTFFSLYSIVGAGAVMEFNQDVLDAFADARRPLLLLLAPLLAWFLRGRRLVPSGRAPLRTLACLAAGFLLSQFAAWEIIQNMSEGAVSTRYLYEEAFVPTLAVERFGIFTATRLDARNLFFPREMRQPAEEPPAQARPAPAATPQEEAPETPRYIANTLDIDFDALAQSAPNQTLRGMHEYFRQVQPTLQNKYTGMFQGKNLIWICAESFSSWALDPFKTPALFRLANEGFIFTNFYNPLWYVSTSDGEYTTTTGLVPKTGVWSFSLSGRRRMPFAMGRQLSKLGYRCHAYHNHSYTYYDRHISHPNMGYDYKGVGKGLEITNQWPESDLEMMEVTLPEYIEEERFHAYYMTVSGHLGYNFLGNMMAVKHEKDVTDLPYSEAPRAYIACNMELDLAVGYLIERLAAAGRLEDTVIVISNDHYPFRLTSQELAELQGAPVDEDFERFRTTLIIWNSAMKEPVVVDKPCDPIDILATLSNLMGLAYDSRLLMGRDILDERDEGLVVFENHSWITEKGRYNAKHNTFTPAPGAAVEEGYAAKTMNRVNRIFDYSAKILETDYYRQVLPDW
jgi:arylsulfatase A-like enzyme